MTELLSIRIAAGTKKRLEALSQSVNRSKSFLAAEAITNYVEAEERQLGEIAEGIAELDANKTVPHEKVAKWLATWGTPGESKAPR